MRPTIQKLFVTLQKMYTQIIRKVIHTRSIVERERSFRVESVATRSLDIHDSKSAKEQNCLEVVSKVSSV